MPPSRTQKRFQRIKHYNAIEQRAKLSHTSYSNLVAIHVRTGVSLQDAASILLSWVVCTLPREELDNLVTGGKGRKS